MVTRFLVRRGRGGLLSELTKAFTTWLPQKERVRAQGIMWLSARWGGAFTPPLVALVMSHVGWRHAFEIFGALGVIWAVLFYRWYRNNPLDNPHSTRPSATCSARTRQLMPPATATCPGAKFLESQQVWMICLQYFCLSYGWYFYITWLPTYFSAGAPSGYQIGGLLQYRAAVLGRPRQSGQRLDRAPGCVRIGGAWRQTRRIMAYFGFAGPAGFWCSPRA